MPTTTAAICTTCSAGYYCTSGDSQTDCPEGYYCPSGTGSDWQPCPAGTFSTQTRLETADSCTQCSFGSYCSMENAQAVTGDCSAGFYCTEGADTPTPGRFLMLIVNWQN